MSGYSPPSNQDMSPPAVLWDVDFDFFLDSERTVLEDRNKDYWLRPEMLLDAHRSAPRTPVVHHRECLRLWDQADLRGWICIHFDAHPDLFDEADPGLGNLPLGRRGDCVTDGNYLLIALRDGILARVVWVAPDWQAVEDYRARFDHGNPELADRVEMLRYRDFLTSASAQWVPQRIDGAFSPGFTPLPKLAEFVECFGADETLVDAVAAAWLAVHFRRPAGDSLEWMAHRTIALAESNAALYHGTAVGGMTTLTPSPRGPVFASPSPGFAACFGLGLDDQQGWVHGVDDLTDSRPFVYLLVPADRTECLEQPLYLYHITRDRDRFQPAGAVAGFEYAAPGPVTVDGCRRFERASEALTEYGVRVYVSAVPRIHDPGLLELATRHCGAVEAHFEMRLSDILALPFFAPLPHLFFVARGILVPGASPSTHAAAWLRWLERDLTPRARAYSEQPDSGYHGFGHSVFVARAAALLALKLDRNPLPAMIAGLLHDAGRRDDAADPGHAALGAEIAALVLEPWLGHCLAAPVRAAVVEAIRHHAEEEPAAGDIAACLRDADRLRLAWERGFEPRCFTTPAGVEFARRSPHYLANQLAGLAADEFLELKFEITDQCNLACAFCHQDFGRAAGHQVLDRATYHRFLTQAREEGIDTIRLTGGEPTLLKSITGYLEQAKDLGFHVTVNSNGTALTAARLAALRGLVDCFKISLPAADEPTMTRITGSRSAWRRKWEAIGYLAGYGYSVEILSVMTRENIERFADFVELLEPLGFARWVPLRAEPQAENERPISRADLTVLARHLVAARRRERWEDLTLGLAAPFCALDDPWEAATLFAGGRGCGPVQSLTVTPTGEVVRCYSRRAAVEVRHGLREASRALVEQDFAELPAICQDCGFGFACRGGCRCGWALEETPFGPLDYLADPAGLPERLARALGGGR